MTRSSNADHGHHETSARTCRRRFLELSGAGIGVILAGGVAEGGRCRKASAILKRGDRIDVGSRAKDIIEKAYQTGHDYEKEYGGCSQCTVAALQDALPFLPVDAALFRAASCLDGGATPGGVQNCGGFTGSGMVIGYLCGRTRADKFQGDKKLAQELIRQVYERFKQAYGTVLCQDVRKAADRDCPLVVARAAKWTAEVLLKEFTDYSPTPDCCEKG